ncbi:MAG TPA: hypothetical protein VH857_07770 [Actinomycetes bacterium]|nr:hypothetical protein [Actinomycetes bacterium]
MTPPRLFGIPARDAALVAVLRRGPSDWAHVGRWDLATMTYETGAWLHGTVYPQRCDVSPDGRYLCYFALKAGADWSAGPTYVAVSRLPWLTALAAWGTGGTWTRGLHFVDDRDSWPLEAPDAGDVAPLRRLYGLAVTRPASFAVERRGGWTETDTTPEQAHNDVWDEKRAERIVMQRTNPRGRVVLTVRGGQAAFRGLPDWFEPPLYALDDDVVVDVQWADWAPDGRLLVATVDGRLQVRSGPLYDDVDWEVDLSGLSPDPQPAPPEAADW